MNLNKSFPTFMKKKSEVVNDLVDFVTMVKNETGETPKFIRCDNTGENVKACEI